MLSQISVQNIALIDEVSVELGDGLNIITGETGAGKSILLGAINLALSAKSAKEVVRDPEQNASVDLLFTDVSDEVAAALSGMDIDASDREVLISRRFGVGGRGTSRVNGVTVTAAQVKQIAQLLIDVHGQHELQSLLNSAFHIEILDRFDERIMERKPRMAELWNRSLEINRELSRLTENEREKDRLLALMQYESDEIAAANLREGEEDELNELRKKLLYAGRLKEDSLKAHELLRSGEGGECAVDLMNSALSLIESAERFDEGFFREKKEELMNAVAIAEDLAQELRGYSESIEGDEGRLNETEERLDLIHRLKSKYGRTVEEILRYKEKNDAEIRKLENVAETIAALRSEEAKNRAEAEALAAELTALRSDAGERIGAEITKILATLQFSDPAFVIELSPKELSAKGADEVRFMIRANKGDSIRPLAQIASGGELSRVMLAIKTVLAEQDEIGTLIFDEIDSGISGRTAQSVAEKMDRIAGFRQVIAVTHLPQIAAMADRHLCISKVEENGQTYTRVTPLDRSAQVQELARMVGGVEITPAVLENAREMKELALAWKAAEPHEEA